MQLTTKYSAINCCELNYLNMSKSKKKIACTIEGIHSILPYTNSTCHNLWHKKVLPKYTGWILQKNASPTNSDTKSNFLGQPVYIFSYRGMFSVRKLSV